ncbi:MAG: tRNA (N(6)-L-threonylcarbamoyladenosine(37)-C(2))-methylthiotransferase MtaB [Desulfobulbaceae bacterium]|nr:tRNA (N(6)-L-threonylcarbamoyladenosine(37)-C(2))-methylthiotransferase MtaB [Desulfobulbaceae bacterium]
MSAKTKIVKTVGIATLGCKVNQYESASFQTGFEELGLELVDMKSRPDICVVNTCAVTGKAGAQSRRLVRKVLREHPKSRVVVTGCFAQIASQEIVELADRPICIVGNGYKHLLVDIAVAAQHCDLEMYMGDIGTRKEICDLPVRRFSDRTRAYLRVQDGCNRFCSYCIVPYSRGRCRSQSPDKVLAQVEVFAAEDYKELVITGIHTGAYGHDLEPRMELLDLLQSMANRFPDLRYRLSSLEPTEISDELLDFMAATDCIMPHFHIPLQSGDDEVLKQMNRRYSGADFAKIVNRCATKLPGSAFGIDVLVGFPGESEAAFQNTCDLLASLSVTYLHVFPYSQRPGTVAASMADQIPGPVKEERVAILKQLDHKKRTEFYAQQVGTVHKVLAENAKNKHRRMRGFSENYVPILFKAPAEIANQVVSVRVDRVDGESVFGTMLEGDGE